MTTARRSLATCSSRPSTCTTTPARTYRPTAGHCRVARGTRRGLAGAARGARHRRAQHGRVGGAQRAAQRHGGETRLAAHAAQARHARHSASRRAIGARRALDRPAARGNALHRAVRAPRQDSQRRDHRSASRQPARRGLARTRPVRAPRGAAPPSSAARRRAVLCDRRDDGEVGGRSRRPLARRRPVPLASALARHVDPRFALAFPAAHQRIVYEAGHSTCSAIPPCTSRSAAG